MGNTSQRQHRPLPRAIPNNGNIDLYYGQYLTLFKASAVDDDHNAVHDGVRNEGDVLLMLLGDTSTIQLYCQVSIQLHEECFVVPSILITSK